MNRSLARLVPALLLAACGSGGGTTPLTPASTTTVPVDVHGYAFDGEVAVLAGTDAGLTLVRVADGLVVRLPLAVHAASLPVAVAGGRGVLLADEAASGADLNGDGDGEDQVVHVFDRDLGVTNLFRTAELFPGPVATPELQAWFTDSAGVEVLRDGAAAPTALGLPTFLEVVARDERLAIGEARFVGDRAELLHALLLYDARTDTLRDTGLAFDVAFSATRVDVQLEGSLLVGRAVEGTIDRNGDGDSEDTLLAILDLDTGAARFTTLAARDYVLDGGLVVAAESEASTGDSNGDGDALDFRLLLVDELGTVQLLSEALVPKFGYAVADGRVAYIESEPTLGADVNGDGDALDQVPVLHDLRTGVARPAAPTATSSHLLTAGYSAFFVFEGEDGVDRNGDGDAFDSILHVHEIATGEVRDLGLADGFQEALLGEELLVFAALESGVRDLNGDGDTVDRVVQVYELATGRLTNLGLARDPFAPAMSLVGRRVVVPVSEADQGRDLNADGDLVDTVPVFVSLP